MTNPSRDMSAQSGLIFPFALTILIVFSLLIAMVARNVRDAQERARAVSEETFYSLASLSVEQEIIFRAFVEYYAKEYSGGLVNPSYQYKSIPPPENGWNLKSNKFKWKGMYYSDYQIGSASQDLYVSIQDNVGLFDVNYQQSNYIEYIANIMEVPDSDIRRATDILLDYIDSNKVPRLRGEEGSSYSSGGRPANTKMRSASEICGLPVWRDVPLCLDRARLHTLFVARQGGAAGFHAMSPHILDIVVPNWTELGQAKSLQSWENTQRTHGFLNKNYGLNGDGRDLTVVISQNKSRIRKRFRVIVEGVEGARPYAILDEVFENIPDTPVSGDDPEAVEPGTPESGES